MGRILVVTEQNESYKPVLAALRQADFEVTVAWSSQQMVGLVQLDRPDLILLDWALRSTNSHTLLTQIRRLILDDLPVLVLGTSPLHDCLTSLAAGADGFLPKSAQGEEVVAHVRALLRRSLRLRAALAPAALPTPLLRHGELALDRAGHVAYLNGVPLDLTRSEFKLLALLMSAPGRLFSRADVLRHLWQNDYIPGDRSVDNIVLRLRRKLGEYGRDVETVWGVGYRLRPSFYPAAHSTGLHERNAEL
jgi:DNA-binding response OmpR family regulator